MSTRRRLVRRRKVGYEKETVSPEFIKACAERRRKLKGTVVNKFVLSDVVNSDCDVYYDKQQKEFIFLEEEPETKPETAEVNKTVIITILHDSIIKALSKLCAEESSSEKWIIEMCPLMNPCSKLHTNRDAFFHWIHTRHNCDVLANVSMDVYEEMRNHPLYDKWKESKQVNVKVDPGTSVVTEIKKKKRKEVKVWGTLNECPGCDGPIFIFHDISKNVYVSTCGVIGTEIDFNKTTKKIIKKPTGLENCGWILEEEIYLTEN